MTNISDEYIAEAALGDAYGNPRREREENPFIRFVNSGWGVAMICAIVSLVAVVALAKWGQTEPPVGYADRFEFSYEITYDTGKAWDGHPAPGETINVQTCITNLGEAFGAYGFSAHAQFVLQEDRSVRLEGYYPVIDAAWHTVKQGQQGYLTTHFFIPENAVCGVYDLVLSYGGVERIFEGAITVGKSLLAPDQFIFSYEMTNMDGSPISGSLTRGSSFLINTTIVNQGAPFTHMGSSSEFCAHPLFMWNSDHSVTIHTDFISNDDEGPHVIKTGEKWQESFAFTIPDDAPAGAYDLELSCLGIGQTFEGVLTIGEPEETTPLDRFSFGYMPAQGVATPDTIFEMTAWVVNDGDEFTFVGDPNDFSPTAVLYHQDSVYTVLGNRAPTGIPDRPCTVAHGQMGKSSYSFYFPEDAPVGSYRLVLSYGEEKQTFEDVLTIIQISPSTESVLPAWTGPYSEEKHITAIETYAESYASIDYGTSLPVTSVVFDAGFEAEDCRVVWVGPYEYTAQNEPANAVEKDIPCLADGRNIHVDTSWWYSDKAGNKTWAYLVCATDASGVEHYFYFRVDYFKYAPDAQDHILFAWEGEKTDQKLLAAIEEYTANYTPIDYGAYIPVNRVVINTDYAIESCKLASADLLDHEDHEREAAALAILADWLITIPTDHQIIVNTSAIIDEWSLSTACSYLIQVTGTDGKQRYYYFRVDHKPFAGPFDLSYVPLVDDSHVLEAWTGEYSTEKHAAAIEEYEAHYTPIEYGPDVPVTSLCFELDFIPAGVSSHRICKADGMETDPGHQYLLYLHYQIQGNRFYLNTQFSLSHASSLLYGILDTEGVEHYYYFRIDSSVYQPPTEDEA